MLNEERIILMTKMASYEEHEGKKNVAIGKFFRSDYISLQIMKSFLCATIAFFVIFGLFILYDFEMFMQDLYKMDLLQFATTTLIRYVVVVVVYCIFSYVLFAYKYSRAKKSLKCYYHNLRKINSMYEQ